MELEEVVSPQQITKTAQVHVLGNGGEHTVYPETEDEIARILTYASENGKSVSIIGGGTKRGFGGTKDSDDILLSLEKFAGVIEHVPGDMTVTVKPGTVMKDIQEFLAGHNQMISLDPEWPEYATIGGIVASNSSGPKRLKYGSARDHVIGMRVVYPDGRITRTGGKVVKNVAGYDMNKLFVGSMGTLGVISEITLKLRPLPKQEKLVLLSFSKENWEKLRPFTVGFLDSTIEPVSLELMNPALSKKLADIESYTLAVAFEDVESAVAFQEKWLAENKPAEMNMTVMEKDEAVSFWKRFTELSPKDPSSSSDMRASVKTGSKNMDVFHLMVETDRLHHESGAAVYGHGGLGHGVAKMYIEGPEDKVITAVKSIRAKAEELGGYAVITHLPLAVRRQISVWGNQPSYFFLLSGIKKQADPEKILNTGRFVGGI